MSQSVIYKSAKYSYRTLEDKQKYLSEKMSEWNIQSISINEEIGCLEIGLLKYTEDIKDIINNYIDLDNTIFKEEMPLIETIAVKCGQNCNSSLGDFSLCVGVQYNTGTKGFLTCAHGVSGLNQSVYIDDTSGEIGKTIAYKYGGKVEAAVVESSTTIGGGSLLYTGSREFRNSGNYYTAGTLGYLKGGFPTGTSVVSYGRTSNSWTATITNTNRWYLKAFTLFTNMVEINNPGQHGDSGGPASVTINVNGLYYTYVAGVNILREESGAYGVYCDMDNIIDEFGFNTQGWY